MRLPGRPPLPAYVVMGPITTFLCRGWSITTDRSPWARLSDLASHPQQPLPMITSGRGDLPGLSSISACYHGFGLGVGGRWRGRVGRFRIYLAGRGTALARTTSAYNLALNLGMRRWVPKSTKTMPKRFW